MAQLVLLEESTSKTLRNSSTFSVFPECARDWMVFNHPRHGRYGWCGSNLVALRSDSESEGMEALHKKNITSWNIGDTPDYETNKFLETGDLHVVTSQIEPTSFAEVTSKFYIWKPPTQEWGHCAPPYTSFFDNKTNQDLMMSSSLQITSGKVCLVDVNAQSIDVKHDSLEDSSQQSSDWCLWRWYVQLLAELLIWRTFMWTWVWIHQN